MARQKTRVSSEISVETEKKIMIWILQVATMTTRTKNREWYFWQELLWFLWWWAVLIYDDQRDLIPTCHILPLGQKDRCETVAVVDVLPPSEYGQQTSTDKKKKKSSPSRVTEARQRSSDGASWRPESAQRFNRHTQHEATKQWSGETAFPVGCHFLPKTALSTDTESHPGKSCRPKHAFLSPAHSLSVSLTRTVS